MNYFVFRILIVFSAGQRVNGVQIQFFRRINLTDLIYESNSTAKCNNVPADKKDVLINSIKTDTCLMVYSDPNCLGGSRKFDLDKTLGWYWYVRSFHICNKDIGGPTLKIDITKYNDFSESSVLESYRDVCTCINVPKYVQNMDGWSINNYGNDFLAYYQPSCSENKWKVEHFAAGNDCAGSNCMHFYQKVDWVTTNTVDKIQSIGPNPNSTYFKTSCTQVLVKNQTVDSVLVDNGSISNFGTDVLKVQRNISSLATKNKQLEKQNTLLTEMKAMKNITVELKSKLENRYKSLEDSVKKSKDDFSNFFLELIDNLSKLFGD